MYLAEEEVAEVPLKNPLFCPPTGRIKRKNASVVGTRAWKRVETQRLDGWATSYDDKLGRRFADVRAICASAARDNTEPIDDTGSPLRRRFAAAAADVYARDVVLSHLLARYADVFGRSSVSRCRDRTVEGLSTV